jgi:hypothetical protein
MSGGALGYASGHIESTIYEMGRHELTPKMRVFRKFLVKVAKAVHDVEWELSDNYGPGGSDKAVDAVLPDGFSLKCAIEEAEEAERNLRAAIDDAKKEKAQP